MNIRQDINGTSPQDLNKMNENFMSMWQKIYGNIDFADGNYNMKQRIMTQWIPVQGEGNLDSSYPLEVRFFVPPNVSKVKTSPFNVRCEHYRMDSGVAKGGGGVEEVEIAMSMQSSNVAVSTNASTNAIISTELNGISESKPVKLWGAPNMDKIVPTNVVIDYSADPPDETRNKYMDLYTKHFYYMNSGGGLVLTAPLLKGVKGDSFGWYLDMSLIQHTHDISHTHSFSLTQSPHKHDIALEPHTHSASGKINIDPHIHELNEGIKISSVSPKNVDVYVNNTKVTTLSENNATANNIDIANYVKIGEWNTIKIETTSLARCTIYGTLEAIMKR